LFNISEEGRKKAISQYRILAAVMGIAATALLICGILAVTQYPDGGFGPPYYIGGFIGGILVRQYFYNVAFNSSL